MYTVGRAGELTGVPAATLRKWEQRYGVVSPARTDGNYRLYDDEAVRRLCAMRDLVDAGWSARDAARQVLASPSASAPRPVSPTTVPARAPDGSRVDVVSLTECAARFDALGVQHVLEREFAAGRPDEVIDRWLLPSLNHLGEAWARGEVSVAGEHFVSAAVQRRLARLFDEFQPSDRGAPPVLVGLARGSRHELGVLAFAVALRCRGLAVTYLGADVPLESWVDAVRRLGPGATVVGVPLVEDLPAVRELVRALAPHTTVYLGGAYQDRVDGATALGHAPGAAAAELAERLAVVTDQGADGATTAPAD